MDIESFKLSGNDSIAKLSGLFGVIADFSSILSLLIFFLYLFFNVYIIYYIVSLLLI